MTIGFTENDGKGIDRSGLFLLRNPKPARGFG